MEPVSAGSVMLESLLPSGVDVHNLDAGKVDQLVAQIVEKNPQQAHTYVSLLGKLFFDYATEKGFSIGLEDYENREAERKQILDEFEASVEKVVDSNAPKKVKYEKISELAEGVQKSLGKQNLNYLLKKRKTSALMAASGARGNPGQLMQASASPVLSADAAGNPVPLPIRHSYAEGLSLGETAAVSFGARHNTIMAQLSTAKPGAIFKWLAPNLMHEVITEHDCGTKHGQIFPIEERKSLLYRVQAGSNKIIDTPRYQQLLRDGVKRVEVRTPLTCKARDGICQLCYGYDSNMHFPPLGVNVGVMAAQSISEKLTQSILSTKHTGGLAGKKKDNYAMTNNFLMNPKKFMDEATLATHDGLVQSVETTPLGDHKIFISGVEHYVPSSQEVTVKAGDHAHKGEPISSGVINPRQLVGLKGMEPTQRYFAHTLRNLYNGSTENSQKMGSLDPRHFDVVARNMVKYVEIEDPGEFELLPGETISIQRLHKLLKPHEHEVPVGEALGKVYSETGETVTKEMLSFFKEEGRQEIPVVNSHLKVKPLVKGLMTNKLADPDWMSKLTFTHLSDTMVNAATKGEKSSLHGYDPVLPYVVGREFGQGEGSRY